MTMTNEELLKLPADAFKEYWLRAAEENELKKLDVRLLEERNDLAACICDACITAKGFIPCNQIGECSIKMAEHLMSLGWRRMDHVANEAFTELSSRLRIIVNPENVDHYSIARCYMIAIENEYVKNSYLDLHERLLKGVKAK